MWNPGEFVKLYINNPEEGEEEVITSGIIDEYYGSSDVRYFIGRGYNESDPYFNGAIENIKLYAGILRHKFIESQFHENTYPVWPNVYKTITINCNNNGGIRHSSSGFMDFINSGEIKIVRVAPVYNTGTGNNEGWLKIENFIPDVGYNFDRIEVINGPQNSNYKWNYDELPSQINAYFNTINDYVPGIEYLKDQRVRYDDGSGVRYYICQVGHGPGNNYNPNNHTPQNPTNMLFDYWLEIWKDNVTYETNRHLVQYPYFSINNMYEYFRCIGEDNPIIIPPDNPSDWKSTKYHINMNYYEGDIVIGESDYGPFSYKCLKENGSGTPNGVREPIETGFINEYWSSLWSPGRHYPDKFTIVEYEGSFYLNIIASDILAGENYLPTIKDYWIPLSFWDIGVTYEKTDVVEAYDDIEQKIVKYICYSSNTGEPLQNDNYWRRFYLWPNTSNNNVYYGGEIVVSNNYLDNKLYICTNEGDGHDPFDPANIDQQPGLPTCTFWVEWTP